MELHSRVIEPKSGQPTSVAIFLHGRGSDEEDLLPLAPLMGSEARVYSIRAPIPFGPGWAWYGIGRDGSANLEQWRASVEALEGFVAALPADNQKALPLVVMGFSQGGMMAGALAIRRRREGLAAVISLSAPPLPEVPETGTLDGLPVFWGHGTEDPVVIPERGEEALRLLQRAGARVTAHRYPISHTISEGEIADIQRWLREIHVNY